MLAEYRQQVVGLQLVAQYRRPRPSRWAAGFCGQSVDPHGDTWNGPEWVFSQMGSQIVYHRRTLGKYYLAEATEGMSGNWVTTTYPGTEGRYNPRGSKNFSDPKPVVHYLGLPGSILWRGPQSTGREHTIVGVRDGHIADDIQIMSLIIDGPGSDDQVGIYDFNTGLIDTVTSGGGAKERPGRTRNPM